MNILKFIKTLGEFEKPVFTINDATRILDVDKEYARLYLHRLKSKGVMLAVERNKYSLADTHPYAIASNLVFPSYISFLTAVPVQACRELAGLQGRHGSSKNIWS